MRHFVVREEGGNYEFMSKRRWQRERRRVPIFGIMTGEGRVIFDRILLGLGNHPLRGDWARNANQYGRLNAPVLRKHAGLGRGEGQAGWKDARYTSMRDWSPGARYLCDNFGAYRP